MKVLKESAIAQLLEFVPRSYPTNVDYYIISESTSVEVEVLSHATTTSGGYLQITNTFSLVEDEFYKLSVYDSATDRLVFRGKIFCTNQDVIDYDINDNKYITYGG
jgi:hypothetical protein